MGRLFGAFILVVVASAVGFGTATFLSRQTKEPPIRREAGAPADEPPVNAPLKLTDEQIKSAGIELGPVEAGTFVRRILVPGTIVPSADRIARVGIRISATVAELRKRPGDAVAKDEILAILESRELADSKSEYLSARLNDELQQDLFGRDQTLWNQRLISELQFIKSRNLASQTKMHLNTTRQKLLAIGLEASEIDSIPRQPEGQLRRQEVRSPIAGRVIERRVDTGAVVGRDSLETELFVIVDLSRVWVELAISPADLPIIREGQPVEVTARSVTERAFGKVIFINPMLDKESRSARVMAEIANDGDIWRPGSFVTVAVAVEQRELALSVPSSAVQSIDGAKIVFVRTPEGFAKRAVLLGRDDGRVVEIVKGLQQGELVARNNSFLLKAEMLKVSGED